MPAGLENIATATAGAFECGVAMAIAAVIVIFFLTLLPVAKRPLAEVPAFIPAIFSAASLAQMLTATLFFVQWRLTGLAQLAVLAIAFGTAAFTGLAFFVTYPDVFSRNGLFGAWGHTSGWLFFIEEFAFGALVIAFCILDRYPRTVSRSQMRIVGACVAAGVAVAVAGCIMLGDLLPATSIGRALTPMYTRALIPFLLGEYFVVCAILMWTRVRTVANVWLLVVCGCNMLEIVSSGSLSAQRFAIGWYSARFLHLISASVLLYVFLVKINDLLVRLASSNRVLTKRTQTDAVALAEGEQRYRLLTNAVPQLIWTADAGGRIDYVNDRWSAYAGTDLVKTQTHGWLQAVHPDDRPAVTDGWTAALRTGSPLAYEYRVREGVTGRYRWFLVNALAIRDTGGSIMRWIATSTDIDSAKHIDEREMYLAECSERLGASIDMAMTLDTVTLLAVPRLCDWCRIDMLDEDGRFVPAAAASTDPQETDVLRALVGHPVESLLQESLKRLVARRETIVRAAPEAFAGTPQHPRDEAVYRHVPAATTIVVPLASGESAIAILWLVFASERAVSADELSLARDFGRRAALALEHARLYERERATADALQRAMLPAQLPLLEHIKFSASYSAASESQRVGGDFYDAFVLPDGRVALTIGDVTGHGLEAAVIMGEIRQALRAAAFEFAGPSAILDRASRLLVASGRTVFVTAIFGVLDVATGRFAYATAGHPPPLLFHAGDVVALTSSGLPIGLRDDDGVDFALTLHAPCTLTLYTDGLMEFAHDLDDGERRIEAAIRELAPGKTEQLAASIMKRVLGADEATDDIAILTASIDRFPLEAAGDEREWSFLSSDAIAAALARHDIGDLVARAHPAERFAAELAFGELVANAVRHAPGPVVAGCQIAADGTATISLDDTGSGFVPASLQDDVFAESGRGLALLRRLTDEVRVGRAPSGGARVSVRLDGANAFCATRPRPSLDDTP